MSTSFNSRSSSTSPDEYPLLTSAKLSRLLLDKEMNFAVLTAFSSSPLSTVLLQQYLFLSHNLERIQQDLTCHQLEREYIFDVLSHSALFQDIITPIILNFRLQQQQVSPVNPPPTFQTSSDSSVLECIKTSQSVIIQERSNSNDSLLSFYTPTHDEPGTHNNPIDIDQLLDPSPLPPRVPVYSPLEHNPCPSLLPALCASHFHSMCLVRSRHLFLLRQSWTHRTKLQHLTMRPTMIQPSLVVLFNLSTIRTYLDYLQHSAILPVRAFQVWYP